MAIEASSALVTETKLTTTQSTLRAAVYVRRSRKPGGAEDTRSAEQQKKECLEEALRRGWEIVGTYVDNDRSASRYSKDSRPQWELLLGDIRAGSIDVIVSWEASRNTRDVEGFAELRRLCLDFNVLLSYGGSLLDFNNDDKPGDPVDIKLTRFLDNVRRYRAATNSRLPRAVMLAFTKYDLVSSEKFKAYGIPELSEMEGMEYGLLLSPLTYTAIEVMTGNGDPPSVVSYTHMENDRKFKTEIDPEFGGFVTKYPYETYSEVVEWIKEIG